MAHRKIIAPQAAAELKNTSIGDGVLPTPQDDNPPAHRAALKSVERRQDRNPEHFSSLSDRVAGEKLYIRNWAWPGGMREFPESVDAPMRFVTKYYPYTEAGKPLCVEEPRNERQMLQAYEKQKLLKKMGFRCIVIESGIVNPDTGKVLKETCLADCLEQLGE